MRRSFIVNPAARTCPKDIAARIRSRFPDARIAFTAAPGDAVNVARAFLETLDPGGEVIVACGGDGTFREVAQVVGRAATLGILPLGTVNQLSAQLSIPQSLEGALEVIERGFAAEVYPGLCRFDSEAIDRMFFIGVSAGPDADAVRLVNPRLKKLLGSLSYGAAFLKRLTRPVSPSVEVAIGGGETFRASQAILLSNGVYGAKFRFSRELTPYKPGIDLVWTSGGRLSALLFFATAALGLPLIGNHKKLGQGSATLSIAPPATFQIDGDMVFATTAQVRSASVPLRVCAGGVPR